MTLEWQPLPFEEGETWKEARKQAHNALQWLVRTAHSYMRQEPGNVQTLLSFDPLRAAFRTRTFLQKHTLELRVPELAMQFTENGHLVPHTLRMEERSPAKVEAWILVELLHRHIDRDFFSKHLPYDFPNLMAGDASEYAPDMLKAELDVITAWLQNAALVAAEFDVAPKDNGKATERDWTLTCWPETFVVARVISGGMRVGLTLGEAGEPYFFKSPAERKMPAFRIPLSRIVSEGLGPKDVAGQLMAAAPSSEQVRAADAR